MTKISNGGNNFSNKFILKFNFSILLDIYLVIIDQLWFHYGPAHLVDLIYRLMGKKPFLVKVSTLMQKSTKALEPFTTNSWEWTHSNMDKLWDEMNDEDQEIFGFDIRPLDWVKYIEVYVQVRTSGNLMNLY